MHTRIRAFLAALRLHPSGVPIYVQLRDQVLTAIGEGVLAPGEQMPTMREVAVALKVDLNTVRRAYDELERLGVVSLVRGRGSFVSRAPERAPAVPPDQALDALARQVLAMAHAARIEPARLAERLVALATETET